jgi:hypothetical protein
MMADTYSAIVKPTRTQMKGKTIIAKTAPTIIADSGRTGKIG